MSRPLILGAVLLALLLGAAGWRIHRSSRLSEIPFETRTSPTQVAPICPWREPDADLSRFFPEASHYTTETRILSGLRLELAGQLGRAPTAEENALRLYRVWRERDPLGTILVRRVKGGHGAIEIVAAVSSAGRVVGIRLQRLREPESIAAVVNRPEWLAAFQGKTAQDVHTPGGSIPEIPEEARATARAIGEGVRSLLVLLDVASKPGAIARAHH